MAFVTPLVSLTAVPTATGASKSQLISTARIPQITAPSRRILYMQTSASPTTVSKSVTAVKARHILVSSEDMAKTIKTMLESNTATFDKIARDISRCETKENGGELGWFRKGTMVPDLEKACFEAVPGEYFVVKSGLGWHVAQIDDKSYEDLLISNDEFQRRYLAKDYKNVQLIDVREKDELNEEGMGLLEGFQHVPTSEYLTWGPALLKGELLDKNKESWVMCKSGHRATQMCVFFAQNGLRNVKFIQGGMIAFNSAK
mmetsp:Transcript_15641/g.27434  ORF Transcript_15641/g.27434 Transcript_15641/m.27434 type:complete len:259 (+) Transcript_15641:93-869(+)|eukprot:CAMPEP_0184692688 /NCGR_PEP_ID=MMETSP0313-20130426/1061_1 /TAXON_ID=2792 /ORGANISM="Porphyridium aerugineum, Strain SAG 1380-2" /LENGTH=258 /DNA_ID=CAMNT_0027150537 /DNA_START=53 /DNA_END=829 /DNA_ORIENTATION=+